MAWHLDVGELAPGATVTYWFAWGGDSDEGAQFVQAHPIPLVLGGDIRIIATAHLEVLEYGMQLRGPEFGGTGGGYWYSVTVRNNGPWTSHVELRGDRVG